MITTYTPSRCRYTIDRLKQHVYLISAASCTIHIDNGNAWVGNLTETPLFIKGAVTLNESTSYDDRFKFTKSVSLTVQNYVNLSYLQGKYYVILEDEGGNYWFVNPDFPCLVTYTYTLGDDVSETQFTFNSLSNFPLLRFTGSLTDVRECEQYVINGLKRLRLTEAKNASYDQSTSTVYLYHGKEFYDVEFLDGTLSITEEFDGNQVNTSIQFAIQLDDYKPSWQYNLLEYQDNRYAAIITTKGADGEFISGFEFGLVPSYSIVGGDSQDDIITITLQGASSYGSLPSGGDSEHSVAMSRWMVVEKPVEYTWRLTNESSCLHIEYRWITLDATVYYYCSGTTKYYKQQLQKSYDSGETWVGTDTYRMGDSAETESVDCGYIPPQYRWVETNDTICIFKGSDDCLKFIAIDDGTFTFNARNGAQLYYSTDSGDTWVTYTSTTPTITAGNEIWWFGKKETSGGSMGYFSSTGRFNVEGNVMSLLGEAANQLSLAGKNEIFYGLFADCSRLISAENMTLPATTLSDSCYNRMFFYCSNLVTPPRSIGSSATTMAGLSCGLMFRGCTSLTTTPELPSLSLAGACYSNMFEGCTSLISASTLPAKTLYGQSYYSMFSGCRSLTSTPLILAETVEYESCALMFSGCTSLTSATTLSSITNMAVDSTTNLPGNRSLRAMFQDCSGLTTPPASIGTSASSMGYCTCMYMFSGCTSLATVPALPALSLGEQCYNHMFNGCTGLVTVPSGLLPATTLAEGCYAFMFNACRYFTTAPDLLAPTLVKECYAGMFRMCDPINYIKCTATDISAVDCTGGWLAFSGGGNGVFVKAAGVEWPEGSSGIPGHWIVIDAT